MLGTHCLAQLLPERQKRFGDVAQLPWVSRRIRSLPRQRYTHARLVSSLPMPSHSIGKLSSFALSSWLLSERSALHEISLGSAIRGKSRTDPVRVTPRRKWSEANKEGGNPTGKGAHDTYCKYRHRTAASPLTRHQSRAENQGHTMPFTADWAVEMVYRLDAMIV